MNNKTDNDLSIIHDAELELAQYFVKICNEYDLKYTMLGGTVLGAIRHKGFIPWDDDMDFGMPRKDYEKLIMILHEKDNSQYVFKNFRFDDIKTYFSRIEFPEYTLIDKSANVIDERHPWIDIFPLDYISGSNNLSFLYLKYKLLFRRLMFQYSNFDTLVNQDLPNRKKYEQILIDLGNKIHPEKFINTQKQLDKLDYELKRMNNASDEYMINFMGIYKFNEMFPKNIYLDLVDYEFEHLRLKGPRDYDYYLSQLYDDYMTPPVDADKNKHHIYLKK